MEQRHAIMQDMMAVLERSPVAAMDTMHVLVLHIPMEILEKSHLIAMGIPRARILRPMVVRLRRYPTHVKEKRHGIYCKLLLFDVR